MDFFDKYVSNFDLTDISINYKYHHSKRVMDNMIIIAKYLNLPRKDLVVAKVIGLLHDFGRFEQYKKYHSFEDRNIDHGDLGSQLIEELNVLAHYNIAKEDYSVVLKAIKNHNKFTIEEGLTNRELLFSKMIRDADKLDILYAFSTNKLKDIVEEDDSEISKRVSDDFFNGKNAQNTAEDTINDRLVTYFGYIYDINYGITFRIIKRNDYYGKLYRVLDHKEIFKPYIDKVNEYINERID